MFWSTLYLIGAIQGLFLGFLLYRSRFEKWKGNLYLAGLAVIVSILLFMFAARIVLGDRIYPWLFWPVIATPALIGPCIFLYLHSICANHCRFEARDATHCLPFVLLLLLFLPESLAPPSAGLVMLDAPSTRFKIMLAAYGKSLLIDGYLLYNLYLLTTSAAKQQFNPSSRRFLQITLGLFLVVAVTGSILSTLFWLDIYALPLADNVELGFLALLTYGLAFYVFFYDVKPTELRGKYQKTVLADTSRRSVAAEITDLMRQQRMFLEETWSARELASILGISEQALSEVLALEFNKNFNQMSNQYRYDHFRSLLASEPEKNLLDLAFASGFKSKSSFNRTVKELSGLSPSALRAQVGRSD